MKNYQKIMPKDGASRYFNCYLVKGFDD